MSSLMSAKHLGAGIPLTFADVDTTGLLNLMHSSLEKGSRGILIATEPSSAKRFGARNFALS